MPKKYFEGNPDLIQKIKVIREVIGGKLDLIEIDDWELVVKVGKGQFMEEYPLEGYLLALQDHFRGYFKRDQLVLRLEKNL